MCARGPPESGLCRDAVILERRRHKCRLGGGSGGVPGGSIELLSPRADALRRPGETVRYAAAIGEGKWTGERRLPFVALVTDPVEEQTILFSIGVLKGAEKQWIAWVSTRGAPWHMDRAGKLLLGE